MRNSYRIANKNAVARKVYARYGFSFLDLIFDISTVLQVDSRFKGDYPSSEFASTDSNDHIACIG